MLRFMTTITFVCLAGTASADRTRGLGRTGADTESSPG